MNNRIMIALVCVVLTAFALGIGSVNLSPVVWRHMLFAAGVVPLILGAMLYFVPVLTRSAPAASGMMWLAAAAAGLGVWAVIVLAHQPEGVVWIAGLLLILVLIEATWIWRRRGAALGGAHACIDWYLAAVIALLLALAVVVLREVFWAYAPMVRKVHLHLNILGFLGLTAIATLRVLLPTVLAVPDIAASVYLRGYLPVAVIATLCVALGAAVWAPLSWLGGAMWMLPALALLKVVRRDAVRGLGVHHAALALSAATSGWLLVVVAGIVHGAGVLRADVLMWLLLYLFLLPLVTGASSYLLPLWRWPGRMTKAHVHMRARLMRYSGLRVLAFYTSAGLALLEIDAAKIPALIALLTYVIQVGLALTARAECRDAAA